jgi:predicted RNA-binding Zn ribbon-like protein
MAHEALPWLVFPPAVDLANTVMVTPAGSRDLLADDDQLEAWIAAERDRIEGVEAASGRLAEVRRLRESVRELLHARARGKRPPDGARRRINAISGSVPIRTTLTADGRAIAEPDAPAPYALFEATVARSAIELAGDQGDRLRVCEAPSCGMLFLREHPRQVWCSQPCGNRARVARHAARRVR